MQIALRFAPKQCDTCELCRGLFVVLTCAGLDTSQLPDVSSRRGLYPLWFWTVLLRLIDANNVKRSDQHQEQHSCVSIVRAYFSLLLCTCSSGWDLGEMETLCLALLYLAGSHRNMTLRQLCGPEYTKKTRANAKRSSWQIFNFCIWCTPVWKQPKVTFYTWIDCRLSCCRSLMDSRNCLEEVGFLAQFCLNPGVIWLQWEHKWSSKAGTFIGFQYQL